MRYRKEIISGLKWTFSNNVSQAIIIALQYWILTKYLEPEDFGVMAVLIVIIGIASIFVEMGIGDAIVQSEDLGDEKLSQLLISSYLLGAVAVVLTNLFGYFVLKLMGMTDYSFLVFLLSLTFFLSPLFYIYSALLEKNLLFAKLNSVSIASFFVGFLVAVFSAVAGARIYALVYGYIAIELSKAVGSYIVGKGLFKFKKSKATKQILPQLKYGSFISGSRLFNYMNSNFDKLIIGKIFGEEILGFYSVAWNIKSIPLRKINAIANSISFPVFSKLKNHKKDTQEVFDAVISFVVLLNIPAYLFLFFAGQETVVMLFDEKWTTMGLVLEWLSLLGIVKVLSNPAGPLILAKGKSNIEMYWNIFWLLVVLGVVSAIGFSGLNIVALSKYLALAGLAVSPIWHYLVIRSTKISYTRIIPLISVIIICFIGMAILNRTITSQTLVLNVGCSIISALAIWIFLDRRGFNLFNFLASRNA